MNVERRNIGLMVPSRALVLVGFLAGCGGSTPGNVQREPQPQPVTADDEVEHPGDRPIEETLSTRFPGVVVTQTAGGLAIRIRGVSSFQSGNEPLYVIDGVAVTPGPGGVLSGLNPYDIESIRVLKNAADTAIWGMRGANGVIEIKTKTR